MVELLEFPQQRTHAGSSKPINEEHIKNKLLIKINPEFRDLLPPLREDEYKGLEESILREGCRDPILLWDNVIIDGHNRHEICSKHEVRFNTKRITFESDVHARVWIRRTQLKERRNLSDADRIKVAICLKDDLEEIARDNSKSNLMQFQTTDNQHSSDSSVRKSRTIETDQETRKRWNDNCVNAQIAKAAGVSTAKVFRYKEIMEHGTPEEIEAVESGQAKIRPTYDKMVERHKAESTASCFPQDKYRVVYADLYERDDSSVGWSPKMLTAKMYDVAMKSFLDEEAVCFLWTPPNYLMETLKVMKCWGFNYSTAFVLENNENAYEIHNALDHMFVLVGDKNGCLPDIKQRFSSVLDKEKYSTNRVMKFRHLIEEMYKEGNKIEFFPEQEALGWDQYQEEAL